MQLLSSLALAGLLSQLGQASPVFETRQSGSFSNPVIFQDLPDIDILRVGDVFYYSSSTFAYSPGAPIWKSYDLVKWYPVGHSVPTLDFGSAYDLTNGQSAYVGGIWASTLRYRESDDTFYWMGCIQEGKTYVYTSPGNGALENGGDVDNWDWSLQGTIDSCYYDNGLLFDDDDTPYVVYGRYDIKVAQLSPDGLSEVRSEVVFSSTDVYLEGSHLYKAKGYYWIVPTKVASGEWVLRSESIWGPYEERELFDSVPGPLSNAGWAHQGGMVEAQDGSWHYLAFLDAYPAGRIPVLAPMEWSNDNWPSMVLDNGSWGVNYPVPVDTTKSVPDFPETDDFSTGALSPFWEWNHNPDTSAFSFAEGGGLVLKTATVTDNIYWARNTLTHRINGPKAEAIFELDISQLANGDRAGAALFRDESAYIAVQKGSSGSEFIYVTGANLDQNGWKPVNAGSVQASAAVPGDASTVYFRIEVDVTPAFNQPRSRATSFSYSTDGSTWTVLGDDYLLTNIWQFFSGYRFAVFNFATEALGGQVTLKSFTTRNI